jgi:hypothetical protein
MATETTTTRGIMLPCPRCGEAEANIMLHLGDQTLQCCECEEEFDADELRGIMARWVKVLAWMEQMTGGKP